jgi:hypothetical protein
MRILHRFAGTTISLLVIAGAAFLLRAAVMPGQWQPLVLTLEANRFTAACAAAGAVCLVAIYALTFGRPRRRERILSFETEDGTVSISTTAIGDYLSKLNAEFPSIVRMDPRVVPRRNAVDIVLDVRIKAGPQIHEICSVLQKRIRETMTSGLGISEVRRVEVRVVEISQEHRAA